MDNNKIFKKPFESTRSKSVSERKGQVSKSSKKNRASIPQESPGADNLTLQNDYSQAMKQSEVESIVGIAQLQMFFVLLIIQQPNKTPYQAFFSV